MLIPSWLLCTAFFFKVSAPRSRSFARILHDGPEAAVYEAQRMACYSRCSGGPRRPAAAHDLTGMGQLPKWHFHAPLKSCEHH